MSEPTITVTKFGYVAPVSCCMLTASTGEDHCDHPAPTYSPIPWHRRLRWTLSAWWYDHGPRLHFGPCDHRDCS